VREFEERVKFMFLEGLLPGTVHQCQGQEATAVGVCAALNGDDVITSTHRPHGHALAKGVTAESMMIELFGGGGGCCRGKGGSMHVGDMAKGMIPAIAIVGGGLPVAAGAALAFKLRGEKRVCACFFGDGATSEGAFHEAATLAAIWNLPVVFACENNFYGASTPVSKITRLPHLADRAAGYGIPGETVDGNDVVAVYEAARRAVGRARAGEGPTLLEMETYRVTGHSRRDGCHYQPKDERALWAKKNPMERLAHGLTAAGRATENELAARRKAVDAELDAAIAAAKAAPPPDPATLTTDVFAAEGSRT
jgi:pyruvate dehydrogenase E1 component alpha subunit